MKSAIDFLTKRASHVWIRALDDRREASPYGTPFVCVYLCSKVWDQVQTEQMEGISMAIYTPTKLRRRLPNLRTEIYGQIIQEIRTHANEEDGFVIVAHDLESDEIIVQSVGYEPKEDDDNNVVAE